MLTNEHIITTTIIRQMLEPYSGTTSTLENKKALKTAHKSNVHGKDGSGDHPTEQVLKRPDNAGRMK